MSALRDGADFGYHYSRLCEPSQAEYDLNGLERLADGMRMPTEDVSIIDDTFSATVYFGQFIDHDVTRDETRLTVERYPEPEMTRNFRTPWLDLDSLYGKGPEFERTEVDHNPDDFLYDHSAPGREKFRLDPIDQPRSVEPPLLTPGDLPRRDDFKAVLADDRNDENLIIAQLTTVFLKFHNRIVDLLAHDPPLIDDVGGASVFEKARRLVIWHYQYLVVHDFLPKVLTISLRRAIFGSPGYRPVCFDPEPGKPVALPVEFAMAAFRFGHSMVRENYQLNQSTGRQLGELLRRTPRRLRANEVIDWRMFVGAPGMQNLAHPIDTKLAPGLLGLPPEVVELFTGNPATTIPSLPARTLLRGARARLPSGEEACRKFNIPCEEVLPGERNYSVLEEHGMLGRTPLWYYILHEAALRGTDTPGQGRRAYGERLGPLGGLIVGEVIRGLLRADLCSYFHVRPSWRPPTPQVVYLPAGLPQPINTLKRLIAFALSGAG